ncbi:MAG: HAMP domain-containing protein [Geobacter sp.]|nr:HAMP domain-containing protein [Geobacter sp.]
MKMSFRSKLMLSYLALLLVMSTAIYFYLNHSLQVSIVGSLKETLGSEAKLTASMMLRDSADIRHSAPLLAMEAGRSSAARVTIIDHQGRVIGDSEIPVDKLAEVENHLDRPEVRQALATGRGESIRYSATIRTDMLYVAVPLASHGDQRGIVRFALPLSSVDQALNRMHTMLGIGLCLALLLSLILSDIFSRLTSRPLRQIAATAAGIGKGDFSRRLPNVWHDELGDLARIMNEMAARLEEQLLTLSREKSRLDAILKGMGEGLMVTDRQGFISLVNPAFCSLFGVTEGVIGAPLSHISRHPALHESFSRVCGSGCELLEEMTLKFAGDKVLLTHWVPLGGDSASNGVVAVFHDITDIKRLENIRKDFVANVSHELRTPVTVIKGYAETLLDGLIKDNPEQAQKFIAVILSHSERLTTLITDILNLSELESAGFALELHSCEVEAVVRRAAAMVEKKAAAKGVAVVLPERSVTKALADPGRLEQVLVNLLDNAVKYTPSGGRVEVLVDSDADMLSVAVRDNGAGVPEESIPRLFERFYRVDAGRSRSEGGTGLGLAIVKHIVQLHGGTVKAENNRPARGATFSFTLQKGD